MTAERFLLDSSLVITAHRSRSPNPVADRFRDLVSRNQAAINEIVRFECLVGCRNDDELHRSEDVLEALELLPLDRAVWATASRLGFELRHLGVATPLADVVIAATAIRHSTTLVHIDRDFERIAQHSDLHTESHLDAA